MLRFTREGASPVRVQIADLVIGGMTARDEAAIRHHVEEMAAIGVKLPNEFPFFFRVSAGFLTQAPRIQVLGHDTSGEVEPVVVSLADGLWLTVGSDHTDRKVEAYSINVSKQMCPHAIAAHLWRFGDVAGHWDKLIIRSWTTREGRRELYQEGPLALMRHPDDLMRRYGGLGTNTVMFGGTIGAIGPLAHADAFDMELEDPVLGRSIRHRYAIDALPMLR
jgi:hypothetical protein